MMLSSVYLQKSGNVALAYGKRMICQYFSYGKAFWRRFSGEAVLFYPKQEKRAYF